MTNYERIKQMSAKEMARLLGSVFVDCNEYTRTINGKTIFDSFNSIEESEYKKLLIKYGGYAQNVQQNNKE